MMKVKLYPLLALLAIMLAQQVKSQNQVGEREIENFDLSSRYSQFVKMNDEEFALIIDNKLVKYNSSLEEIFTVPLAPSDVYCSMGYNTRTNTMLVSGSIGKKKYWNRYMMLIDMNDGEILRQQNWWEVDEPADNVIFSEGGKKALAYTRTGEKRSTNVKLRMLDTHSLEQKESAYLTGKREGAYIPFFINEEEFVLPIVPEQQKEFKLVFFNKEGEADGEIVQPLDLDGKVRYSSKLVSPISANEFLMAFSKYLNDELVGVDVWRINRQSGEINLIRDISLDKDFLMSNVLPHCDFSPLSRQNKQTVNKALKLKKLKDYKLTGLYSINEDKILVVCENKWDYYNSTARRWFHEYHSDNVITLCLDFNGQVLWSNMFERKATHRDINSRSTFKARYAGVNQLPQLGKNSIRMIYSEWRRMRYHIVAREMDIHTGAFIRSEVLEDYTSSGINSYYSGWLNEDNIILMTATGTDFALNTNKIRLRSLQFEK